MQYYSKEKQFQNLNNLYNNTPININKSILPQPPIYKNSFEYNINNNNEQYFPFYTPNIQGLNTMTGNLFNINKDIIIGKSNLNRGVMNKNIDELKKKEINEKNGGNENNQNIKFSTKKENPKISHNIQLNENLEYQNKEFNFFDNNFLNNNSYNNYFPNEKFKFSQNINNEEKINTKKRINKKLKKVGLLNRKTKNNNLKSDDNKPINKNVYEEIINSFNYKSLNQKYCDDFTKPQNPNKKTNVINSSIININSNQKSNNNIKNTNFKDNLNNLNNDNKDKNLYNRSIQNYINKNENLIKLSNNETNNEKSNEKSCYVPQIFESQNSLINIGGIDYTTLLVPKRYLERIKARFYQS